MLEGWKCPVCGVGVHPLEKVCPNCVNKQIHFNIQYTSTKHLGVSLGSACKVGTDVGINYTPSISASFTADTLNLIAEARKMNQEYVAKLSEKEQELLFGKPEC